MTFRRILIANRGEIALRVIRACRELDIESIAVYSDADARAPHVLAADWAVRIGPPPAADSYLSFRAVLDAARATGADAIHPGYGFLSENAAFASACADAGIVFIGPPPAVIAQLGSKTAARALADRVGVPVVPGATPADQSIAAIAAAAAQVGFPVLLKPTEGGGGIGMKRVFRPDDVEALAQQAAREARAAFGDGRLYVERLFERPRHVEIQMFADAHGQVVSLFERECSVQRRHQKVIEESPSPALTPALRARMGDAAVAIARAAGYQGAGTVEFLVDGEGDTAHFYFLEVNTRLQVEHPVTEQVTGVDLVAAQIAVAQGDRLPWTAADLSQRGHAIEARVYAEDPTRDDFPQAGPLLVYREPTLPGVRIDSGVREGQEVSVHYDPLLAKVIATGRTRDAARRRLIHALESFPILGIRTNVAFLAAILEHPAFTAGQFDVTFLAQHGDNIRQSVAAPPPPEVVALAEQAEVRSQAAQSASPSIGADPWDTLVNHAS